MDADNYKRNSIYYNQLLRDSSKQPKRKAVEEKNFAKKEVNFSRFLLVPPGYEVLAYILYFVLLPYLVGLSFLFLYVAKGVYTNFSLLDLNSFLIIWAIGYEIAAAIILLFVFFSFLKHLKNS